MRSTRSPATSEGFWRGEAPARHGDDYWFVVDGVERPDPASRWQPDGVRGPSRVLDTAQFDLEPVRPALDELVLYELHVGTFTQEGTFDAAIRHLRRACRARGDRGRGDADRDVPRHAWLGLRRALHLGAARGVRRARRRSHASSTRRTTRGSASCSTSSTTTSARATRRLRAFGPYFTDRHETFWGDALDYSRAGGARVGDPERGALGARLRRRRPSARRRARGLRRLAAPRPRRARRTRARDRAAHARDRRKWSRATCGRSRSGGTTPSGPTSSTTSCTCSDGGARGLLRGLRLGRRPRRAAATEAGRAADRLLAEPRPGRQPRRRRPAGGRRAAPARRRAALRAADAAPVHGRGVRRAPPLPVLHRPHRPGDRGGDARGSPPRVPSSRGEVPDPQAARRSRRRSSTARSPTRSCARSTESCSTCGESCRARSRWRSTARTCVRVAGTSSCTPTSTRRPSRCGVERLAGKAVPARRDVGRGGHELLALLRERGAGRALSLRRRRRDGGSRSASAPRSTGTATCRASARARATAFACTARTSRSAASASTRRSC